METQLKNPNALRPGTVLDSGSGKYTLVEYLKGGGMAIAYVASTKIRYGKIWHEVKVVIKELFPSSECRRCDSGRVEFTPGLEERLKKDFRYEAKKLSELEHPNIVNVNECFEANNTLYYVMQRLDGISLTDYIASHGAISAAEVRKLLDPVFRAMTYIHSQKILHLDLTPNNVMILADGDACVIDFGCSVHYSAQGRATKSVISGSYTPGYAPVEQINNQLETFSPQTDVYALAGMVYYCVTGKHPAIVPDFSLLDHSSLQPVIAFAMTYNASDRTPSVQRFVEELDAAIGKTGEQKKQEEVEEEKKPKIEEQKKPEVKEEGKPTVIKPRILGKIGLDEEGKPTVIKPKKEPEKLKEKPKEEPKKNDWARFVNPENLDVIIQAPDNGWKAFVSLEKWEKLPERMKNEWMPVGVALVRRADQTGRGYLAFGVALRDLEDENGRHLFAQKQAKAHVHQLPTQDKMAMINSNRKEINQVLAAIGGTPLRRMYCEVGINGYVGIKYLRDEGGAIGMPMANMAAIRPVLPLIGDLSSGV